MGGTHSLELNHLTRTIWFRCFERHIWISAANEFAKNLTIVSNAAADRASRIFRDQTE